MFNLNINYLPSSLPIPIYQNTLTPICAMHHLDSEINVKFHIYGVQSSLILLEIDDCYNYNYHLWNGFAATQFFLKAFPIV